MTPWPRSLDEPLRRAWTTVGPWKALLALSLLSGAAVRVWLALTDLGVHWPDEVYQSLEPAHRLVYGRSVVAWEFVAGARNFFFPWLLAATLKVLSVLGLDGPSRYLPVLRVGLALSSMVTVAGVYRLSKALRSSLPAAVAATTALAWMSLAIYFAPRAASEVVTAAPVTWGLALLLGVPLGPTPRWKLVVGASLLGAAVLLRLHCGLFAGGALVTLLVQRRFRDAAWVGAVLAGWAVAYGLIDLVTWGGFLHSALFYLRFNVLEGRAAEWGTAPTAFYTKHLVKSLGVHWVLLAVLGLLGLRRATPVVLLAAAFLLGHLALPHKELRFLVPMLPLLCVAAGAGLDQVRAVRPLLGLGVLVTLLVTSALSFATFRSLTRRDLGQWDEGSAYDVGGPQSRLLVAASKQEDLCGLALLVGNRHDTFAFTALHRDVPFYGFDAPPRDARHYNYVIAAEGAEAGDVIATDHGVSLVRVSRAPCVKDAAWVPWLDERTRQVAQGPQSRWKR
ncbi:MAG: hypothetical protein JNJ54_36625 [Myxococcaceae bacterium]|nr:hypothetical protein [Myxococcaceae bacterium]